MAELEEIKDKVRNLLELAADAPDDAEGQTAFLLAQKLMAAHHMSQRGKYYELSGKALVYYRKGFIVGLMDKFDEQKRQDESLALAVIVPQEVHKALEDGGITDTRKDNVPECGDPIAYLMGYESGKELNTDRKKGIE